MARLGPRRLSRWGTAALVVCISFVAAPARAADAGALYASHEAVAAVTADIDADGARELVLVTARALAPSRQVEIWDHDDSWASVASAPLSIAPSGGAARPLDPERESLALLAWRRGGQEVALLATAGDAADYGGGCCLGLTTVEVSEGRIGLGSLAVPEMRAEEVHVLDMDADGTDELLVIEPPDGASDRYAQVLRWNGAGFAADRVALGHDDRIGRAVHVGETDGRPGAEAVAVVDGGSRLLRIGLDADGGTSVERGEITDGPQATLWSWGVGAGAIVVQHGTQLRVLRWPLGGGIETAARAARPEYPELAVVGDGREALIVDRGVVGFDPRRAPGVDLLDLGLEPLGFVGAAEPVQRLWRLANVTMPALRSQLDSLLPYVGPLPGGTAAGVWGYVSAGNLITVDAGGRHAVRPMSSLTGLAPIGIAGPDGAWWVLDDGHLGARDWAVMVVNPGLLRSVSIAPAAGVLTPDDDATLPVELTDAVVVDGPDGTRTLRARAEGFEVTVAGDPGSLVLGVLDQFVVHEGTLPEGSVTLPMRPLARRDGASASIEAAVVRIDPAGRVAFAAWEGDVVRGPPALAASAETHLLAGTAVVRGETAPGTGVSIDGSEVSVAVDGTFEADVPAPIWPREVRVVARDALGNEAVERLHVVGFVDYRALPWVPVVALATLAAGLFLFLRTPRRREAPPAWTDAALEEIDADRE